MVRELAKLRAGKGAPLPSLVLPFHHDVRKDDVVLRRLRGAIAAAHERGPEDFAELLLTPGVGARTVFALALVAEVVHGAPSRFTDPARYSLAHGGKDGHPYPVPRRVYDETLRVMRDAVARAKLGNEDKLSAIRRLDAESRRLERAAPDVDFDAFVEEEWDRSPERDGMTVMGPAAAVRAQIRGDVEATLPPAPQRRAPRAEPTPQLTLPHLTRAAGAGRAPKR